MDISTGRCPNRKQDCDCKKVCAVLYGKEVRRLRNEAVDASPDQREKKYKEWQRFMKEYANRI